MAMGHWTRLNHTTRATPPYSLDALRGVYRESERVTSCAARTPGWLFGWQDLEHHAGGPSLLDADGLCARLNGTNLLLIGDSLTLQLHDSWKARLRQRQFRQRQESPAAAAAGVVCVNASSPRKGCEGPAPDLCAGFCPRAHQWSMDDNDPQSAWFSACDRAHEHGATVYHAQAYKCVGHAQAQPAHALRSPRLPRPLSQTHRRSHSALALLCVRCACAVRMLY